MSIPICAKIINWLQKENYQHAYLSVETLKKYIGCKDKIFFRNCFLCALQRQTASRRFT